MHLIQFKFRFNMICSEYYKIATVENTRRTASPYFRRRYGYTSTKAPSKPSTVEPETVSISGIARNSDQDHEPSIVERKFSQHQIGSSSNNQIDLGTEIISQGLGEAITSISRAPLPFVPSTTVRNVKITSPGTIKYVDDNLEYQISKRADSLSSGCKFSTEFTFDL